MLVDVQQNRLKRIQEVRQQESSISQSQLRKYRSEVENSKTSRKNQSKYLKEVKLGNVQQELIIQWQRALLNHGNAHISTVPRQNTEIHLSIIKKR